MDKCNVGKREYMFFINIFDDLYWFVLSIMTKKTLTNIYYDVSIHNNNNNDVSIHNIYSLDMQGR